MRANGSMHRKAIFFAILILIICSTLNPHARGVGPTIERRGDEFVLALPEEMAAALAQFNPRFKTWETGDYTATVRNAVRGAANPQRVPFALIVDADRDGIPDVILDGHDDRESLLICVFSRPRNCEVVVIRRQDLMAPNKIINYHDGKMEIGLDYLLSDSCVWSSEPVFDKDKTFVFQIVYFQQADAERELLKGGGSISYYFENGKFREGDFDPI